MDTNVVLLLLAGALGLAVLVYLMWQAATRPQWTRFSKENKAEMRKLEKERK